MIVLVSVAHDVDRMEPVRDDPARARKIIETLLGAPVVSCQVAAHTAAPDDYVVTFEESFTFPPGSVDGEVATAHQQGVGYIVANLAWEDYATPIQDGGLPILLREVPDYDDRVVTTVDQYGTVHDVRPFNDTENAIADEREARAAAITLREGNRANLAARVDTALSVNNQFIALTNPTSADALPYLKQVARELNGILRIISGRLDDVSDSF